MKIQVLIEEAKSYLSEEVSETVGTILGWLGGATYAASVLKGKFVYGKEDGKEYVQLLSKRGKKGNPNYFRVTYDEGKDTYILSFGRIDNIDFVAGEEFDDVYGEDLARIIGDKLGVNLSR